LRKEIEIKFLGTFYTDITGFLCLTKQRGIQKKDWEDGYENVSQLVSYYILG